MIYIIIISIIFAYISNIYLYKICNEIKKSKYNTIFIYVSILLINILIFQKYNSTEQILKYISLIPFIIIISIIDYHTTNIYDITLLSGIIMQGIVLILTIGYQTSLISHIIGLLMGVTISYILAKTTKGLGEGDIGLFGLCCFALGHNYSFYLISLSFVIASIYCMYLLIIKSGKIRTIPFAPFISLSTIIIILTKYDILNIYLNIIGN